MVMVTVYAMHSARSDSLRELNVRTNYVCTNYTYGNIRYVDIPRSGDRQECIAFTITSLFES